MPIPVAVGVFLTIASVMMSAYAQQVAAKNAARQARYQQELSERQAEDARKQGEVEAEKLALKSNQFMSKQRALIGMSGVAVNVGAPVDLIEESAAYGQLDLSTASANAFRVAWGHTSEAAAFGLRASSALSSGRIGAAATIAGGAIGIATDKSIEWKDFWGKK